MRQILLNGSGALVARMPRPTVNRGEVLVRTHYSLISTGTELASLRPGATAGDAQAPSAPAVALRYLGKAVRDPAKAARRLAGIARRLVADRMPRPAREARTIDDGTGLGWERVGAVEFAYRDGRLELVTDASEFGYQALSREIAIEPGMVPIVEIDGEVADGPVALGLLADGRSRWLGNRAFDPGPLRDRLIFDAGDATGMTLVVSNAGTKATSRLSLSAVRVTMAAKEVDGLPQSELADQGWNVGYSLAGEVVAVGEGVDGIAVGDRVACAGAGKANHADYAAVPRNLVCALPRGCDLRAAATATVGTIALQGVRRAAPQIGETVAVLGLGLIGQITVQILRAAGARVIGLDLDAERVARARRHGMDAGCTEPDAFRLLVRDLTAGRGADRVLVTAATPSDAPINLAMEVARRKATVVIVGDVGLNVKREAFYRKEIDLLMSTSYGPGRYDRAYEDEGHDYPAAYVRWTLNRNMEAYLELAASGRIDPCALIERVVPVSEAPAAYRELSRPDAKLPLAVLLHYPDDERPLPEASDATRISIRGHRVAHGGVIRYALVGAGAFGTSMLVPQMARRKDRFFLRGIVSRNATTAGNFARANQVEVVASRLDDVLSDPDFDLIVIATRHHEHADQVVRCLDAGKHVFVEKPLAITWDQLERVVACRERNAGGPLLMAGFNRRFAPAMRALRAALAGRRSPLMISYRLNGGYIAPESWVQGPEGGGRNIGEACHMYDTFRSLTGSAVESIQAAAIVPGALPYLRNDNFSATLRYADGSVANLLYTALGPREGLPKERVEVFCDGEAYLVDDYRSLVRCRDGQVLWESTAVDKGHFEELSQFGDAIAAATEAPIPFDEIAESTATALRVEELLTT